jgi:hypothetical protein
MLTSWREDQLMCWREDQLMCWRADHLPGRWADLLTSWHDGLVSWRADELTGWWADQLTSWPADSWRADQLSCGVKCERRRCCVQRACSRLVSPLRAYFLSQAGPAKQWGLCEAQYRPTCSISLSICLNFSRRSMFWLKKISSAKDTFKLLSNCGRGIWARGGGAKPIFLRGS